MTAGHDRAESSVTFAGIRTYIQFSDGALYATDLGGGAWMGRILLAAWTVLGLGLLPIFGIGLIFLWVAWRQWHGMHLVDGARRHVQGLPRAILV